MPPRGRKLVETAKNAVGATKATPSPSIKRGVKRKAAQEQSDSGSDFDENPSKKARSTRRAPSSPKKANADATGGEAQAPPPPAPKVDWSIESQPSLPAALNFSYEDARAHLISVDSRFEAMFEKMACRPFVELERVEPFRTLATSIIGQQISWKAARSVNWKFMRLYDDTLPEVIPPPEDYTPPGRFPPPHIVAETDVATLRSAGLSAGKACYIQDLAKHFAEGKLSADMLWSASDDQLYESLIAVKGIGPWTVNMFSIFSLRRPDILPVGDLGTQRGLLRFILAQHTNPGSPVKLSTKSAPEDEVSSSHEVADQLMDATADPVAAIGTMEPPPPPRTPTKKSRGADKEDLIPAPFTPSINRVLAAPVVPTPLPAGLTVATLRARLNGKNRIKGAYLTPREMELLTEPWKPYRSLGVWYMWALADQELDGE